MSKLRLRLAQPVPERLPARRRPPVDRQRFWQDADRGCRLRRRRRAVALPSPQDSDNPAPAAAGRIVVAARCAVPQSRAQRGGDGSARGRRGGARGVGGVRYRVGAVLFCGFLELDAASSWIGFGSGDGGGCLSLHSLLRRSGSGSSIESGRQGMFDAIISVVINTGFVGVVAGINATVCSFCSIVGAAATFHAICHARRTLRGVSVVLLVHVKQGIHAPDATIKDIALLSLAAVVVHDGIGALLSPLLVGVLPRGRRQRQQRRVLRRLTPLLPAREDPVPPKEAQRRRGGRVVAGVLGVVGQGFQPRVQSRLLLARRGNVTTDDGKKLVVSAVRGPGRGRRDRRQGHGRRRGVGVIRDLVRGDVHDDGRVVARGGRRRRPVPPTPSLCPSARRRGRGRRPGRRSQPGRHAHVPRTVPDADTPPEAAVLSRVPLPPLLRAAPLHTPPPLVARVSISDPTLAPRYPPRRHHHGRLERPLSP
mmetsp:Transcript_40420/g.86058  ORF Transcript_40420/g.86058 Transcript_40420/m.86058 type:complete len:480 (-) Transcript_40420:804-2243(-)